MIKLDEYHWFRYINPQEFPIKKAHTDYELVFNNREVYGLQYNAKDENYRLIDKSELEVIFKVSFKDVKTLIERSKGYAGKISGQAVTKGTTLDAVGSPNPKTDTASAVAVTKEDRIEQAASRIPRPKGGTGKPMQVKLKFNLLETRTPVTLSGGKLMIYDPLDSKMLKIWEKAKDYIGIIKKINTKVFPISQNSEMTHILTKRLGSATQDIHVSLCPNQLRMINDGVLDHKIIAQAVTHELGHYVRNNVLKNSEVLMWRRKVGGLNIHKEQYAHGYAYPWEDEHFACMAEYMVHGKCARELQSTIGVEIVERYFDNVHLKDVPDSKYYKG